MNKTNKTKTSYRNLQHHSVSLIALNLTNRSILTLRTTDFSRAEGPYMYKLPYPFAYAFTLS